MPEHVVSMAVHGKLPESYVRAGAERPRLDGVAVDANIPVVDLRNPDRVAVFSHDIFQAMGVGNDFEKAKIYFNVHNWSDYLRLHRHPLEQFVPDWPANPPPFRPLTLETVMKRGSEITTSLAPELANMDMPPDVAANVDTLVELPPEVAANVDATSPKLPPELAANGDVTLLDLEAGTMRQIIQSVIPRASPPTRGQVATSLFVIGSCTAVLGLTAVFHLPAAGPVFGSYKFGYYMVLTIVLAAAALELAMAYSLARSRRILTLAKVGLPVAYLLLLVVFAIGGFVIPFSKVHHVR